MEGTTNITLSNGKPYTVRNDRSRYFYPNEWASFIKTIKPRAKPLFEFLLNTGCRINEALHIRPMDFDFERNNVRIWKTKAKAKKGEKIGKPRTISLSSDYAKRVKKWANRYSNEAYIFPGSQQSVWQMFRRGLKAAGIKDYYMFGLHNIRKTHGMWLKALNVPAEEICLRLGHDYNTYLHHYGSAEVFSESDLRAIEKEMGDLYNRKRRY